MNINEFNLSVCFTSIQNLKRLKTHTVTLNRQHRTVAVIDDPEDVSVVHRFKKPVRYIL